MEAGAAVQVATGVLRVRAANPSPLTLDGTNTYVASRWVVDPGPDDPDHLEAVVAAASDGVEGIVLTHGHADHADGAPSLARMTGASVHRPSDQEEVGPFRALATPGHSADHVCLLLGRTCFTGDTVLGEGSVFIGPGQNAMARYLESLRCLRALDLELLLPGHGPPVEDPAAKLDEYLEHRFDRERRVLEAIERGARTRDEILDRAWSDVPFAAVPGLRIAAHATLAAHLEKLAGEGRLPEGIESPRS